MKTKIHQTEKRSEYIAQQKKKARNFKNNGNKKKTHETLKEKK